MKQLLMSDQNKRRKLDGHSFLTYKEQFGRLDDPRYRRNKRGLWDSPNHDREHDYKMSLARSFDLRTDGIQGPEDFQRHLVRTRELDKMFGPNGPASPQLMELRRIQREVEKMERERSLNEDRI
jgi:hypothetical protein